MNEWGKTGRNESLILKFRVATACQVLLWRQASEKRDKVPAHTFERGKQTLSRYPHQWMWNYRDASYIRMEFNSLWDPSQLGLNWAELWSREEERDLEGQRPWGNQVPHKLNTELPMTQQFHSYILERWKLVHMKICTWMFIASLFVIRKGNHPMCIN